MQPGGGWRVTEIGAGRAQQQAGQIRLTLPQVSSDRYHDAQISDYEAASPHFHNRPPLRFSVQARMEGSPRGTAGFGFWNHVFAPGRRRFRLPRAIWYFFGSPPNDIALARDVPGHGWKAAAINAQRPSFFALLPLALPGFLLMRQKRFYDRFWRIGQRAMGVSEVLLSPALLADFHEYRIDWLADRARFYVDGELMLDAALCISSALGFIAWIDNQYAIVTPQGRFGWGRLELPARQSLILRGLRIDALSQH